MLVPSNTGKFPACAPKDKKEAGSPWQSGLLLLHEEANCLRGFDPLPGVGAIRANACGYVPFTATPEEAPAKNAYGWDIAWGSGELKNAACAGVTWMLKVPGGAL